MAFRALPWLENWHPASCVVWQKKKRTRETHQEMTWGQIKGVQALHTPKFNQQPCPWTTAVKLLTKSSLAGTHSFWGISPLYPPLAKQSYSFLQPDLCLWDSIHHQCIEAEFLAWVPVNLMWKILWEKSPVGASCGSRIDHPWFKHYDLPKVSEAME